MNLSLNPGAMNSLNVRTPFVVQLGEIAIAAGRAGHGLEVRYRDFSGLVLTELWLQHRDQVRAQNVEIVRDRAEARAAATSLKNRSLILVDDSRWTSELALGLEVCRRAKAACPAIFCRDDGNLRDTDSGIPSLVVRGTPANIQEIVDWLATSKLTIPPSSYANAYGMAVPTWLDSRLLGLVRRSSLTYHDYRVIVALLMGAAMRRLCAGDSMLVREVTAEDYAQVYSLLKSPDLGRVEELTDQLTVAMVKRANIYLALCRNRPCTARNDMPNAQHRQITRRELVDLGNPRSAITRRLLKRLLTSQKGLEAFAELGLNRRPPNFNNWPLQPTATTLRRFLRPWTEKKVRTRFDRLFQLGLITADRPKSNGPWVYRIPHELTHAGSLFRALPPPESLSELAAIAASQPRDINCPDLPLDAHAVRQTQFQ